MRLYCWPEWGLILKRNWSDSRLEGDLKAHPSSPASGTGLRTAGFECLKPALCSLLYPPWPRPGSVPAPQARVLFRFSDLPGLAPLPSLQLST